VSVSTPADANAAQEPIRLPLTLLQPMPVTIIEVGGRQVEIGIDTGGHGSIQLTRAVLEDAHAIAISGAADRIGNIYGEARQVRRFRVPEIRLGGRLFTNLEAIEAPEDLKGPPVKNGLGQAFLHQFVVLVDYPAHVISLLPAKTGVAAGTAIGCDGTRIPLEKTSLVNLAISRVSLDGETVRLLWDTGASYSTLPTISAAEHRLKTDPDANGTRFYNATRLEMGGRDFGPLQFVVLPVSIPTEFEGLLGYNVFAKHVVCINYGLREVRIR
jgi:hypothetical protein